MRPEVRGAAAGVAVAARLARCGDPASFAAPGASEAEARPAHPTGHAPRPSQPPEMLIHVQQLSLQQTHAMAPGQNSTLCSNAYVFQQPACMQCSTDYNVQMQIHRAQKLCMTSLNSCNENAAYRETMTPSFYTERTFHASWQCTPELGESPLRSTTSATDVSCTAGPCMTAQNQTVRTD